MILSESQNQFCACSAQPWNVLSRIDVKQKEDCVIMVQRLQYSKNDSNTVYVNIIDNLFVILNDRKVDMPHKSRLL